MQSADDMLVRLLPSLCLGMCVALSCGCEGVEPKVTPEVSIMPVAVVHASCQPSFSYPVTYYGRVEPARQVRLSFELMGRLEEVLVDDGGFVSSGQVIARLDTSLLEAEREVLLARRKVQSALLARLKSGEREEVVAAARADLKRLEVEVARAEAEKERAENVYAGRAISKADYDEALFAYRSAFYALEQSRQQLDEIESGSRDEDIEAQASRVAEVDAEIKRVDVQFEKSILRSPFDGLCIHRSLDAGATISAGETVVEVYEANCLEARFSIPHQDFALAAKTREVEIGGHAFPISDVRVVSRVDDVMRTVDIVMPLQGKTDAPVMPGQTCTLVVKKGEVKDCVELPVASLVSSVRGLWSCYRLQPVSEGNDVHKVEKVDVVVLFTDGDNAIVTCTLPNDSLVVSEGVHRIVPGALVRITEPGEG